MTARCNRCDYRTDVDLAEHALEAGHPLCMVCRTRSLTEHEAQTCAGCVARVHPKLAMRDVTTSTGTFGYQGDGKFCTLRCGYAWAVRRA